jgi:hypothetical protein
VRRQCSGERGAVVNAPWGGAVPNGARPLSETAGGDRGHGEYTPVSRTDRMASGNDMKAANETYAGFINMIKYGSIACAVITIFVVGLIVSH